MSFSSDKKAPIRILMSELSNLSPLDKKQDIPSLMVHSHEKDYVHMLSAG